MLRSFYLIVDDIKRKPYDLLDYAKNTFDRDYLEFNVNIHDLDSQMQVGFFWGGGQDAEWLVCYAEELGDLMSAFVLAACYGLDVGPLLAMQCVTVCLPLTCSLLSPCRHLWTRPLTTSHPQTMLWSCWRSSQRCCSATRCSSSWRASGWCVRLAVGGTGRAGWCVAGCSTGLAAWCHHQLARSTRHLLWSAANPQVIFQHYARDLEVVQATYEAHKHKPPLPRNAPPIVSRPQPDCACRLAHSHVFRLPTPNLITFFSSCPTQAGNIMWARQLLRRIEVPMQRFAKNRALMASKESKRVIRLYNRVAKALVEFEALWHAAWLKVRGRVACGMTAHCWWPSYHTHSCCNTTTPLSNAHLATGHRRPKGRVGGAAAGQAPRQRPAAGQPGPRRDDAHQVGGAACAPSSCRHALEASIDPVSSVQLQLVLLVLVGLGAGATVLPCGPSSLCTVTSLFTERPSTCSSWRFQCLRVRGCCCCRWAISSRRAAVHCVNVAARDWQRGCSGKRLLTQSLNTATPTQEDKFKFYFSQLSHVVREYEAVLSKVSVIPG